MTSISPRFITFGSAECEAAPASEGPLSVYDGAVIDPVEDHAVWDSLVASHPCSTAFHTSAWARVLIGSYRHRPFFFRITAEDRLLGLLPFMEVKSRWTGTRGVSLPFTDYCAPLFFGHVDCAAVWSFLTKVARQRGWKSLAVRGFDPTPASVAPAVSFYQHTVSLIGGEDACRQRLSSSTRRALGKAEKACLQIEISHSLEALREFYTLHQRTRRCHGAPPQPWAFFAHLSREMLIQGQGFVVVAREQGRPIAASVFLTHGAHAIYKYGASDERRQETRANNLVMWSAIQALIARGVFTVDLGRTSIGQEGLRRFKLGWGSQERSVSYFKQQPDTGNWLQESDRSHGFQTALFRRSPLFLNRAVGALLYPHLD